MLQVNMRQWANILKMMDNFEKWNFDIFSYCETLQENALTHFGFKLF